MVVPSPATSDVLDATSRTICAPMFSSPSFNSISFATVTPSLVMVGDPYFFYNHNIAAFGADSSFHRVGQNVDAADGLQRFLSVYDSFCHNRDVFLSEVTIFLQATPAGYLGLH